MYCPNCSLILYDGLFPYDGAGSAYPSGRLITTFVTGQVPLMEQEVFILSEHLRSSYVLRGVRVFFSTINELLL
jgi:hypothetical protein